MAMGLTKWLLKRKGPKEPLYLDFAVGGNVTRELKVSYDTAKGWALEAQKEEAKFLIVIDLYDEPECIYLKKVFCGDLELLDWRLEDLCQRFDNRVLHVIDLSKDIDEQLAGAGYILQP